VLDVQYAARHEVDAIGSPETVDRQAAKDDDVGDADRDDDPVAREDGDPGVDPLRGDDRNRLRDRERAVPSRVERDHLPTRRGQRDRVCKRPTRRRRRASIDVVAQLRRDEGPLSPDDGARSPADEDPYHETEEGDVPSSTRLHEKLLSSGTTAP